MEEIFLSGGLDFDGTETECLSAAKNFRRYDIGKGEWEMLKPLPVPRYMHATVIVRGSVYVIGGCDVGASSPPHASVTPSNEIFRFNNCTWRRLRPMANRRCFFGAVSLHDRFIYVFGGQGENNYVHISVERYDVSCNSWEIMQPMPIPRLGFAIERIDTKIFIVGGLTGSLRMLNRLDIFDTKTNSWSSGPTLPYARAFASMIAMPQNRDFDLVSSNKNAGRDGGEERGGGRKIGDENTGKMRPNKLFLVGGLIGAPDMMLNDVVPVSVPDVVRLDLTREHLSWDTIHRMSVGRTSPHLIPTTPSLFWADSTKNRRPKSRRRNCTP